MSNEHYPYLCGGILLNLLIEAKKTAISSREKLNGKKSSISDADILKGLIKLVTGEEVIGSESTLKKDTSRYKRCEINGSSIITFTKPGTIDIFKNRYTHDWKILLDDCIEFINNYLSERKLEWLTKALFELILNDSFITEDMIFKITQTQKVSKKDLKNISSIDIEIFLVNVLMHIISTKRVNTLGKTTFEKYFKQNNYRAVWKLSHPIGTSITQSIKIKRLMNNVSLVDSDSHVLCDNTYKISPITSNKLQTTQKFKVLNQYINYQNVNYNYFYSSSLYNLIVGGIEKATFKSGSNNIGEFFMPQDRIITEVWCDKLHIPLSKLGIEERAILINLPTIFAVDQGPNGDNNDDLAYFGYIKMIECRFHFVKVIFELEFAFKQHELYKNSFEFRIDNFELYNTHWVVKDVDIVSKIKCMNITKINI